MINKPSAKAINLLSPAVNASRWTRASGYAIFTDLHLRRTMNEQKSAVTKRYNPATIVLSLMENNARCAVCS